MTLSSQPDPRRWWALLLLCAAQFLVILDTSIVGRRATSKGSPRAW